VNLWRLRHPFDQERAMHQAVGGDFAAMGALERDLLKSCGLRENDYLIDVGCGSGRLAKPLAGFLRGKYLGTDIVPSLVRYARDTVGRADWSFKVVEGLAIPERDEVADFVCFFSVLTHTQQVESYRYLREAKRVLKPGGKVVFSFLEYGVPLHWDIFQRNTDKSRGVHPLNEFLSREMIEIWASHLGLRMETMRRGDEEFIPVTEPVVFESGQIMKDTASFGQSVCVLVK
jgi:ubiquinone/menaquinone biosynthesis C-methylase UbiE